MLSLIVAFTPSCSTAPESQNPELYAADDFSVRRADPAVFTGSFTDFITSVYQAPAEEKQALVDSFLHWADSTTGIPYIEDTTAYFLYINGSNPQVAVAGDFTGWDPTNQDFIPLSGTNLFYAAYQFENDARLDYKLVVNGNWILDPLNPSTCSGGYGPNSELSMAAYIQPPEIESYNIPHGSLLSTTFSDTTQGRTRAVRVYTPPDYAEGTQSYRSIYFHDGSEQIDLGFAENVLDFMISQELIPPIIAIFVDPINRNEEYLYDYDFMTMFVNELVPWIDAQYRTMPEAEYRAVAGVSAGGLTSLLFTVQHPDVFGNCGAFSPAIWFGDLIDQYEASPVLPVKIYMDAGTYEPSIYNSSMSLKGILDDDQWNLRWRAWHEGHSWGSWRAHLDDALTYFWPMATSGIDDRY
ncbi:MAG: hypothetical protein H8E26_07310 [FCB group bacterium]|nr:hypothetical protein [FCB group bacterium]MBL7029103.1 hypothetical protein [Candidatus Neomarinimicrobiota bacterium]MBL7122583.1 hypothetical protein [Candidatus Neomarinimicrobiota bacterium]